MPRFPGTVALVTGAGRGRGEAMCFKLAEYGAIVAATDTVIEGAERTSGRIREKGLRGEPFRFDVTSWDDGQRVVKDVEEQLGPIDVLVNNAGVSRYVSFLDLAEAEWDRVLAVKLKGVFN